MDNPSYDLSKQRLIACIVAQLRSMNKQEQRAWVTTMLDHLDTTFIEALSLAYGELPKRKRRRKAG